MYKKILDYEIFSGSMEELFKEIDFEKKTHIVSGNLEILYRGVKCKKLKEEYTSKDSIIIPDGVGTIIASKLVKSPIEKKIAGIELMSYIINESIKLNYSIFFLGAKNEIVKQCVENIKKSYDGVNVAGYNDGFFHLDNCEELVRKINESGAKIIFIAMGSPKQEEFVSKYKDDLCCNLFMGVGGSFDVLSGHLKRAPKIFLKLNLEWLYRVIKEPKRINRLRYIPKFFLLLCRKEIRR